MINYFARLFARITQKKDKNKRKVMIIRFRDYKVTARILAIALEKGLVFIPNFVDNTNYINYLNLTFKDTNSEISIFVLSELRKLGFEKQAEALRAVTDNWYLPISKDNSQMERYIKLLWDLFHTPDPE